eukprot:TRINITY_DN8802_c0_g1_i1.p1 TRINITY_DN8802_c0_g1~~TRINITY_DN8802_c0_g1_i1.p1  ORF type:complete len:321 (-),score=41.89 TRINITY_DN8802_c0_g1_i1:171-1133(-)
MGNQRETSDFHWVLSEEPHASRRKLILAKYPQIKDLYGYDSRTKYLVLSVVLLQIFLSYYMSNASWPVLIAVAWIIGGTCNHWLELAIHEITHNLAFRKPFHNRLFAVFVANVPLAVPSAITFQKYHMEHHMYQGVDGIDMDIPTDLELKFITNAPLKLIWVILQPLFYSIRPLVVKPKPLNKWELINIIHIVTTDTILFYFFGYKAVVYLVASTLLGLGLHPVAGHFIAEHYMFVKGYETYSYYGPLNLLSLNVGYHNEHHDFPKVPGSRLPMIKEIASEYYDNLPVCESWVMVIWNYITDPSIGPFSRVKRQKQAKTE